MCNAAKNYVRSMEILDENAPISDWHLSYYLLATTSLEVSAKLFLFNKVMPDFENLSDIEKKLRSFDHDLSKIYSPETIDIKFLHKAKISKVVKKVTTGIFLYDFKLIEDGAEPIHVYDAESIKYGLMTDKKNLGFVGYQHKELLKLCQNALNATLSLLMGSSGGSQQK